MYFILPLALASSPLRDLALSCALLGSVIGHAAAQTAPVLTRGELTALTEKADSFTPRDQFESAPALSSVSGKRFTYTVAPLPAGPDNSICSGFPMWSFHAPDLSFSWHASYA
jgi:hypothetical protein